MQTMSVSGNHFVKVSFMSLLLSLLFGTSALAQSTNDTIFQEVDFAFSHIRQSVGTSRATFPGPDGTGIIDLSSVDNSFFTEQADLKFDISRLSLRTRASNGGGGSIATGRGIVRFKLIFLGRSPLPGGFLFEQEVDITSLTGAAGCSGLACFDNDFRDVFDLSLTIHAADHLTAFPIQDLVGVKLVLEVSATATRSGSLVQATGSVVGKLILAHEVEQVDLSFSQDPDKLREIITQAVFDTKKLVMNRKTVIRVPVVSTLGPYSGPVSVSAMLGQTMIGTISKVFSNETTKDFEFIFTPQTKGDNQDLVLIIDDPTISGNPSGQIIESDENNNKYMMQGFEVVETHDLKIEFAYREPPTCPNNVCSGTDAEYNDHVQKSTNFLSEIFPLADAGLKTDSRPFSEKDHGPKAIPNSIPRDTSCGNRSISTTFEDDMKYVSKVLKIGKDIDRGIMVVPIEYFNAHFSDPLLLGKVIGVQSAALGMAITLVTSDGQNTAHELGHTFKMPIASLKLSPNNFPAEGYKVDPATCDLIEDGTLVDGYNPNGTGDKKIIDALDFMGAGNKNGGNYWIASGHWDHLVDKFSTKIKDPELITFDIDINRNGTTTLGSWHVFDGTPSFIEPGAYSIVLRDGNGEALETIPFEPNFTRRLETVGFFETDKAPVLYYLPFPIGTASVEVTGPDGEILSKVDPVLKVLNDGVEGIPEQCFIGSANNDRATLLDNLSLVKDLLTNKNVIGAQTKLQEIRSFAENAIVNACEIQDPLAINKEKLLPLLDNSAERLETRVVEAPNVPGDLDGDGDIDVDDFQAFQATFGKCEGQAGYNAKANFDSDTCITFIDYQTWYGLFAAQQ